MKKKSILCLLILGLLILVLVLAACGRISAPGDRVKTIPHGVEWGFTNCLVCHSGGDLALPAVFHPTNPTSEECQNPGCHSVATLTPTTTTPTTTTPTTTTPTTTTPTTTTPTTTTPTTTTPPTTTPGGPAISSHGIGPGYDGNCTICHGAGALYAFPEDHSGRTNDECFDCHELPEPE